MNVFTRYLIWLTNRVGRVSARFGRWEIPEFHT